MFNGLNVWMNIYLSTKFLIFLSMASSSSVTKQNFS